MKYLRVTGILLILFLSQDVYSQKAGNAFISIDSVYIPQNKKGRLEVIFHRFMRDVNYQTGAPDLNFTETFYGYKNELKVTDVKQILEPHNFIINFSFNAPDPLTIINRVLVQIQNINDKKIAGNFTPVIISDSLGFYKYYAGKPELIDTNKIKFFLQEPYLLNNSQLQKSLDKQLPNSCFVYFINSENINNSDATLDQIITNPAKKYEGNSAPYVVPYIIESLTVPLYLNNFIRKTACPYDTVIVDPNLTRFHRNFQKILIANFEFKYAVTLDTKKPTYKGELRSLILKWKNKNLADTLAYSYGSSDYPLNIKELNKDWIFWVSCIFSGLLIILGIFFVLSILYPLIEEKKFVKKYVSPYFPINNIVKLDTMTNEPIENGTLVVHRCKEIVPFYIWKGLGNQCPSYPECMDYLGCDGSGKSDINYKFFSQSGNMRKFNWLFYGACGGFLAWLISLTIIPFFGWINFGNMFNFIYHSTPSPYMDLFYFQSNIVHQASIGFGIGLGLGAALIIADYFSSIIRPNFAICIAKIFGCGLVTALIFGIVNALSFRFQLNTFLSGLISWSLFSVILSFSISLLSPSINFKRAIVATAAGVILSFLLFHLSSELTNIGYEDFSSNRQLFLEVIKIIRLILLGALTGYIATNVLKKLEEYELILLSPDQVRDRVIPISKILNSRATVTIGSSPKNVIFIKWTDPGAEESHASINLTNEGVVLLSHAEIIINKEYLSKGSKHLLKDNDTIQLGRHSSTLLQFKIKYS